MIRFPFDEGPQMLCSIDPVTLGTIGTLALGASAGGAAAVAASSGGGDAAAPATPATPAAPNPASTPAAKPKGKTQNTSFLGSTLVPPSSGGGKSLLGQ
jgi:hypothetical protein